MDKNSPKIIMDKYSPQLVAVAGQPVTQNQHTNQDKIEQTMINFSQALGMKIGQRLNKDFNVKSDGDSNGNVSPDYVIDPPEININIDIGHDSPQKQDLKRKRVEPEHVDIMGYLKTVMPNIRTRQELEQRLHERCLMLQILDVDYWIKNLNMENELKRRRMLLDIIELDIDIEKQSRRLKRIREKIRLANGDVAI